MRITWLGQAGLLFENDIGKIIVDPYLSDSVAKVNPKNKRRIPVNEEIFKIRPDVIIITHNHLDHFDMETLIHFMDTDNSIQVLSPISVWQEVKNFGKNHNYLLFNRNTEITINGIKFKAVKAEHSDLNAIGVIIDDKYYATGDTLYNTEIFKDLPDGIDTVFLPINGVGNNMNMEDAKRFSQKVNAKNVVPLHWGLFDDINPIKFDCENKVIPKIYEVIGL